MRVQSIQNNSPDFNANLKIIDRFGILKGKGENASKNIYARFFSSKELTEARKIFKEKTKDIKGDLYISVHTESYRGEDISKIKLKQYPPKTYENSVPVSILDCTAPNKTVVFDNDVYNIADKPTFNRANELKQDYDKIRQSALRTYEEKRPKLNEDSELSQQLDKLCKQKLDELAQGKTPGENLDLEIHKVLKQISDEEIRLEEELYKPVLGRKPKNLKQFINGLVKILKILDRKGKNIMS